MPDCAGRAPGARWTATLACLPKTATMMVMSTASCNATGPASGWLRFYLNDVNEECASFELFQDAHSRLPQPEKPVAMKPSHRPAARLPERLGLILQALQAWLGGWMPQPALVPIPIRTERRTRDVADRRRRLGG